jgi:hypothetical protein
MRIAGRSPVEVSWVLALGVVAAAAVFWSERRGTGATSPA